MNIVFDIGGVLTDFDWDAFVHSMYDEKTAHVITEVMWHNPDWAEFDKANLSDEQILQMFIKRAPDYAQQIRKVFSRLGDCQQKKESTIPLIQKLKADGHKVYYLSNYFEYLMHVAPTALDFLPLMDGGIFSCYEHVIKPNAKIFRILCDRYALQPSECVFIDDSIKNIKGAEAFGMQTIHYSGQTVESLYKMISDIADEQ